MKLSSIAHGAMPSCFFFTTYSSVGSKAFVEWSVGLAERTALSTPFMTLLRLLFPHLPIFYCGAPSRYVSHHSGVGMLGARGVHPISNDDHIFSWKLDLILLGYIGFAPSFFDSFHCPCLCYQTLWHACWLLLGTVPKGNKHPITT